jgi:hypothetical protein
MMRRKRTSMTTAELAKLNEQWQLWRRPRDKSKAFPKAWQVFLRAQTAGYRWLFDVVGDKHAATVTLRSDWSKKPKG